MTTNIVFDEVVGTVEPDTPPPEAAAAGGQTQEPSQELEMEQMRAKMRRLAAREARLHAD